MVDPTLLLDAEDYIRLIEQTETKPIEGDLLAYFLDETLEKAKILMRDPQMSMMEIAERVGYEDYSHFSKLFKKHERYSPVEYRKNFC